MKHTIEDTYKNQKKKKFKRQPRYALEVEVFMENPFEEETTIGLKRTKSVEVFFDANKSDELTAATTVERRRPDPRVLQFRPDRVPQKTGHILQCL